MNLHEQIASALNLNGGQSEDLVLGAVRKLAKEHGEMKLKLDNYQKLEQEQATAAVIALVDGAIKDRKFPTDSRAQYICLAEANFETAKAIIDKMPAVVDLSEQAQNDSEGKTYKPGAAWNEKFRETGQID